MTRTYRSSLFIVLGLLLFCSTGSARQMEMEVGKGKLGVEWQTPSSQEEAFARLDTLGNLGVRWLLVDEKLDEELWNRIREHGFHVYGTVPLRFPITRTFLQPDSTMLGTIEAFVNHYASHPSTEAIGLFSYGPVSDPVFRAAVAPYSRQVGESFDGKLYYVHAGPPEGNVPPSFDFFIQRLRVDYDFRQNTRGLIHDAIDAGAALLYAPAPAVAGKITPFKWFLKQHAEGTHPAFVGADWLFGAFERFPQLRSVIRLYTSRSESQFIFPEPEENIPVPSRHSGVVALLLAIWGIFVANYYVNPFYRKSLIRYFLSHTFFVDDVMERHVRTSGSTVILLGQHLVLTGICFYSLGSSLFPALGMEALAHHYPTFFPAGANPASLFLLGCLLSLVLSLTSILWVGLLNKNIKQFGQVVNLYAWPLQLNFVVATLMVALLVTGQSDFWIMATGGIFIAIHLLAFLVTCFDSSRKLMKNKVLFLAVTAGIYLMGLSALATWYHLSDLPEVISLAKSLSIS